VNIAEVVLVYVCIPAGVTGIVATLVFGPGIARRPRYRPGETWSHEPVWFGPHPKMLDSELQELLAGTHDAGSPAAALTTRSQLAITAGSGESADSPESPTAAAPELADVATARGGAHGDW
jgi:hypothetical protein